ncbi:MAG: DUF3050 domain-containing protein [Xenococcaceae cyanobacterium MO_207.B15]|nr:DUF3050 domain-containing protein [Xenococcaceae cyanobacterium MO_207.B15]
MPTTKFVTKKASYVQLLEQTDRWRTALYLHPVYQQVNNPVSLKIFMESHVFAVWDFMTLLKTLQRRLTGMDLPWLPPQDILSARLVNEIVLAEETDEVAPGHYLSHFHLYLAAMEEVGASTQQICNFISNLKKGSSAPEALALLSLSESTKSFVLHTLAAAQGRTHEVAAVFLLGREDIIPKIFQQIIDQLENSQNFSTNSFMLYLKRHTELDEKYHAPMGQKLLKNLCGSDSVKWHQAFLAAQKALQARKLLWDGITQSIQEFSRQ